MTYPAVTPAPEPLTLQASMDAQNQAVLLELRTMQIEQVYALREIKGRVGCLYQWLILSIVLGVLLGGCSVLAYLGGLAR
jgi:hypothetical protein